MAHGANGQSLTSEPLEMLRSAHTFILDLDGTVYLSDRLIEGARELVDFLRETGRR